MSKKQQIVYNYLKGDGSRSNHRAKNCYHLNSYVENFNSDHKFFFTKEGRIKVIGLNKKIDLIRYIADSNGFVD